MISRRIKCAAAWTAMLLWMAVIFGLSSQTRTQSEEFSGEVIGQVVQTVDPQFGELPAEEKTIALEGWHTTVRKVGHIAEFAVLAVLVWITMGFHISRWWRRMLVTAGIGILYAVSDELHQMFVSGRGPQITDVLIDLVGVCVGLAIAAGVTRWRRTRKTG